MAEFEFTGEFDEQRALRLIQNLRDEAAKARADRDEAVQRATALEATVARAGIDRIRAVAAERHKLPTHLADFINAESEEDIERQAERLASLTSGPAPSLPHRPRPRLTPSAEDAAPPKPKQVPGSGEPVRTSVTVEDLATMSPEQVDQLRREGQLDHIMDGG